MRIVAQNVRSANVSVHNSFVGQIDRGLLLFVGFTNDDDETIVARMAEKIVKERVFMDENNMTNLSIKDIKGEILSISQFTLYADVKKGLRPSFTNALEPIKAKALYELFNECLDQLLGNPIARGQFGEEMVVGIINDGPFTMVYDSKELFNL